MQEDPVLLTPEDKKQKPYVAIIKVISCLYFLVVKIICVVNVDLQFTSAAYQSLY